MKKIIADLLLIAGVIVASIAAGESRRVSKIVSLDDDLSAESLYAPVPGTAAEGADPEAPVPNLYETGTPVTPDVVAYFRAQGASSISVLRQPKSSEVLSVEGTAALGRALSDAVILTDETEEARAGRFLDENFIERLRASELSTVRVSYKPAIEEGSEEDPEPVEVAWNLREAEQNPAGIELEGCQLEEAVTVPLRLKPSTFLDQPTLTRLADSGFESVSVKIPTKFSWSNWNMRWIFVVGAVLTLFGVLLKRTKVSGITVQAGEAHVATLVADLVALQEAVTELLAQAEELDAEDIHHAVDPLLSGPIYRFAEGREAIRTAHGGAVYMKVMDAFARGERKVNRTWSAAVDGYVEEARVSLGAALGPLTEAREALPGAELVASAESA